MTVSYTVGVKFNDYVENMTVSYTVGVKFDGNMMSSPPAFRS